MSYKAGIAAAIADMNDRMGSSMISIKKWMQAKLPADKKWMNAQYLSSLKSGVAAGDFIQNKVRAVVNTIGNTNTSHMLPSLNTVIKWGTPTFLHASFATHSHTNHCCF